MTWTQERVAEAQRILCWLADRLLPYDRTGQRADLVQDAWIRLLSGEQFEESHGIPFRSFVLQRGRWAMQDAARRSVLVGTFRVDAYVQTAPSVMSLDAPSPSGVPWTESLQAAPTVTADPFLSRRIRHALTQLEPRRRRILLASTQPGGQRRQAAREGVNESRGSQLRRSALVKFRKALRAQGVEIAA